MKEQLELSLEQPEKEERDQIPFPGGKNAPCVTLSLGAVSSLQQIAPWQVSDEQPEAVQAIIVKSSAMKDVSSCW